jgi:hypothetical protein
MIYIYCERWIKILQAKRKRKTKPKKGHEGLCEYINENIIKKMDGRN